MTASSRGRPLALAFACMLAGLSGCGTSRPTVVSQFEDFDSANTHSRTFAASDARTCEAARRALLSQGYVIGAAGNDSVQGKKSYQPQPEVHVEVEFRIVCAREGPTGRSTIAFVSALQDRYALRKSNSSASLGVGALGSVSLPFSGSEDSLVKVASETITSEQFYKRFYALLERYLAGQPLTPEEQAAAAAARVPPKPVAPPTPKVVPEAAVASPVAPPASAPSAPIAPVPVPVPVPAAAASSVAAPAAPASAASGV